MPPHSNDSLAKERPPGGAATQEADPLLRRIDFRGSGEQRTSNPPGWEAYDGSVYTAERGYGWLTDLSHSGWDRGESEEIILPDGSRSSPRAMGRPELASWQGTHQENQPLVFRVDLPDGWYRVTCTSVDPGSTPLPLVNQRSIKFRAHNAILAGPAYGAPLQVGGNQLVEGTGLVEVTEGHLRIVVGDPAYGGWTWSYLGPWYRGWDAWFGALSHQRYANNWYQRLTRTVDPGYHSLRFNSLEIEPADEPARQSPLIFRDFFNRDDSHDLNSGLPGIASWAQVNLHPAYPDRVRSELSKTAIALTGPSKGKGAVGIIQRKPSPATGSMRYSTRVSLYTGAGSQLHSGSQEAGLLILGGVDGVSEFNSTFVGVAYDSSSRETPGWVKYRVGNGRGGYRTDSEIPDTRLPFRVTEGEYEIIVEHDTDSNTLSRIRINGVDITDYWAASERQQQVSHGLFGMRAFMDAQGSGVSLQQFYWYYRVEDASSAPQHQTRSN